MSEGKYIQNAHMNVSTTKHADTDDKTKSSPPGVHISLISTMMFLRNVSTHGYLFVNVLCCS